MTHVIKQGKQTETVEEGKVEAMNAGKQTHGLSLVEPGDDNAMGEKFNTQPPPDTPFNPDNLTNPDLCIDELNKRYALVNAGNKIVVVDEHADGPGPLLLQQHNRRSHAEFIRSQAVVTGGHGEYRADTPDQAAGGRFLRREEETLQDIAHTALIITARYRRLGIDVKRDNRARNDVPVVIHLDRNNRLCDIC